jgi:hypothetical protein
MESTVVIAGLGVTGPPGRCLYRRAACLRFCLGIIRRHQTRTEP